MTIHKNIEDYYWWQSEEKRRRSGLRDFMGRELNPEDKSSAHVQLLYLVRYVNESSVIEAQSAIESKNFINLVNCQINILEETLLHVAAKYNNADITACLLDLGAKVNEQNKLGKTPLMLAVEVDQWHYISLPTVKLLIEANANIYISDSSGKTALHHVLNSKAFPNTDIVKIFLHKVYNDCGNNNELTAKQLFNSGCTLERAIFLGNPEVTKKMLDLGCSIDGRHPHFGHTALHLAVSLMDLENVELLVRHNANINTKDFNGSTPIRYYCYTPDSPKQQTAILKTLMDKEEIVLIEKPPGQMHISSVLLHGTKESIEVLLQYNIDFYGKDERSQTPLHLLAKNKNSGVTSAMKGRNFEVHALDKASHTPIFYAVHAGNISTFKFLIDNGAQVNITEYNEYERPIVSICNFLWYKNRLELFLYIGLDIQNISDGIYIHDKTVFDRIKKNKTFVLAKSVIAHLAMQKRRGVRIKAIICEKINSHPMFKNHFLLCEQRLRNMKNVVVYPKVTLFTVLIEPIGNIVKHCVYSDSFFIELQKLLNKKYRSNFYYFGIIRRRVEEVISVVKILKKAYGVLCELIQLLFSIDHIIYKIMNYLDYRDIQNLSKLN